MNTLHGTFNKPPKDEDEDEFDEFQNAEAITEASSINWNTEAQKSGIASSQQGTTQQTTNYPPGFTSSMVLTPNNTGKNNRITNKPASNSKNSDLLDLL